MTLFRQKYRIETARLKGWDYTSAGWYFVTICTKNRKCCFGEISAGDILLSTLGEIASQCWLAIPAHFAMVRLDLFTIMPNHVHGIIIIEPSGQSPTPIPPPPGRDVACNVSTGDSNASTDDGNVSTDDGNVSTGNASIVSRVMSDISPKKGSLSTVIRSYKSAVTQWARGNEYKDFAWQPSFHDHIIRDEKSLQKLREYIINNPAKWEEDRFNPKHPSLPR